MATIYIDNKPYDVADGQNVLKAVLSLGLNLPYFCWHPALGSVGACRLCAVKQFKDEQDAKGRIVMGCMTPATDGLRISLGDPEAKQFRENVIEWLMVNHPHDCPVCDEGGECHLQDMTVMSGHDYRRYRYTKRTHRNQYLGPFINHEMNRCIACYRCVRYYRDVAGGHDLQDFASHDSVYFGRHEDGTLESEFSGNLVEVCPTGVFTDKTLKQHYTRKWDQQTAPSICAHCGLGCNTIPGERYGLLRRVLARYNDEVNGYFLCDRGRFGYEHVNNPDRLRAAHVRDDAGGAPQPADRATAIERVKSIVSGARGVIGIGSPRASLEGNFALRELVGADNFYWGVDDGEREALLESLRILRDGTARIASLKDVEQADAVLILGEDVLNTAPMLAHSLQQSVKQRPLNAARKLKIQDWDANGVRYATQTEALSPLFIATPDATKLDGIATETYRAAPEDIARLGFAVAHAIDPVSPGVFPLDSSLSELVKKIAGALREASRPLVIAGPGLRSKAVIQAAANVAWALRQMRGDGRGELCLTAPDCNSMGLAALGGGALSGAAAAVREGRADVAITLENDLTRRADAEAAEALLGAAHLIAIDHYMSPIVERAEVALPASAFAEGDGTTVNNEGRAQRFYQVYAPQGDIQESWRWLRDIAAAVERGAMAQWTNLDDVVNAVAAAIPALAPIAEVAPGADFRAHGQKIARQPHRYSGRTAMLANLTVHEPKPPEDPDSPLAFSMEGFKGPKPAPLVPHFWSPGWNSDQAVNKFQIEIGGPLHGGESGRRLFEPREGGEPAYYQDFPEAFAPRSGEWRLVPAYYIFCSEELSARGPAMVDRAPAMRLRLNDADAAVLGVNDGDAVRIQSDGRTFEADVEIRPELPRGVAGAPVGLEALRGLGLPGWARIAKRAGA